MKTAGVLGGMSWESTSRYYQWLNEGVKDRLGGLHSAKTIVASVDFAEIAALQSSGNWDEAGKLLAAEAQKLERAGADFILLATNTMHRVARDIESAVRIPFVHLADATAERIIQANLSRVGLLGTLYTMEHDFYKGRLANQGLDVVVPGAETRRHVHRVIYDELCLGTINPTSKQAFIDAANGMAAQGAQGVILGCTEITLLVGPQDFNFPVFDTTRIHVEKALSLMLS